VEVHTEARNAAGELLTDATFKVIPLSAERFKEVAGIEEIPEAWREMLE
jgi:hypothetical protein